MENKKDQTNQNVPAHAPVKSCSSTSKKIYHSTQRVMYLGLFSRLSYWEKKNTNKHSVHPCNLMGANNLRSMAAQIIIIIIIIII